MRERRLKRKAMLRDKGEKEKKEKYKARRSKESYK